jgi:hypothetical protein
MQCNNHGDIFILLEFDDQIDTSVLNICEI